MFFGELGYFLAAFGKYEIRHQTMMFIGTTSQMSKSGDKHCTILWFILNFVLVKVNRPTLHTLTVHGEL
jgi:hypothetical protein